jgi:hypothetical protein
MHGDKISNGMKMKNDFGRNLNCGLAKSISFNHKLRYKYFGYYKNITASMKVSGRYAV